MKPVTAWVIFAATLVFAGSFAAFWLAAHAHGGLSPNP